MESLSDHGTRVTLYDIYERDLQDTGVYEAIDVEKFCKHHGLELKED